MQPLVNSRPLNKANQALERLKRKSKETNEQYLKGTGITGEGLNEEDFQMEAPAETDEAVAQAMEARSVVAGLARTPIPATKIKTIVVRFTRVVRDINWRVMPVGIATATYGSGAKLTVPVSGGANVRTYGITDPVNNLAIFRVENRYYRSRKGDSMPYSLFYHRGEALHIGRLDKISHGCIHVADWEKMRRLNQDTVKNRTGVTVNYDPGILLKVMKQRM